MSVELHYPEIVGWGVALFDFKNDGKLDILLCKGRRWPPAIKVPCQTNSVWRASTATIRCVGYHYDATHRLNGYKKVLRDTNAAVE